MRRWSLAILVVLVSLAGVSCEGRSRDSGMIAPTGSGSAPGNEAGSKAIGPGANPEADPEPTKAAAAVAGSSAESPVEAAGLRIHPLVVRPPAEGDVVGTIEVLVENVSLDAIELERLGIHRPVHVEAPGRDGVDFLALPASFPDLFGGSLAPGNELRLAVRVLRLEAEVPLVVRGSVHVRDSSGRLFVIASPPVTLGKEEWPFALPLRGEDLRGASSSGAGVHLLHESTGVFSGWNLLEIHPDGTVAAHVSRWGRGNRGVQGSHRGSLTPEETAALMGQLLAARPEDWAPPDPRAGPGPTDQNSHVFFVAVGSRVFVLRCSSWDLRGKPMEKLVSHLEALRTRVASR